MREDPSRNKLASTAYFIIISSVICMHGVTCNKIQIQKWSNSMFWIDKKKTFEIYIFRVMVIFVFKTVNFQWNFTITRKIKIGKLFQHIPHLAWKWVCISLVVTGPMRIVHERVEINGSVLGRYPGRGYKAGQRSPALQTWCHQYTLLFASYGLAKRLIEYADPK